MNRRKFVVTSTVTVLVLAASVAALALYSSFAVKASIPGLPEAVAWFPADTQAVFGMNVRKFVASPVFSRFEQKHGEKIARDLGEFIARTGVDPRRDLSYVIGGAHAPSGKRGEGVVIAVGTFNAAAITSFIESEKRPIRVDYKGATVLMIPEGDASKVEKGVAFITGSELALGDLETLKQVLDVRSGSAPGILSNEALAPILKDLNPEEMFWFAGDASRIAVKAPANTPIGAGISALQTIVGTLNLTDAVTGRISATARDEESARRLADIARGAVALGQIAGESNPGVTELLKGVSVTQEGNRIRLVVNFPIELLEQLERTGHPPKAAI